jgi:hypothetical protein
MKQMQLRRQKTEIPVQTEQTVLRRQMALAAGTESFANRDPVYHVTEDFHNTFDALGRRHAAALAAEKQKSEGEAADSSPAESDSARSFYERGSPQEQAMLHRFSETAFQRGTLSGAVLEGTGQLMLVSCLKKTICQSQPDKWQQRKLFEKVSLQRNVPAHTPDKVVFNRGFADSAVGLVVDTLRDARRTVDSMRDLALGKSEMGQAGADTLRTMYPFLDDSRERALLGQYRENLKTEEGPDMRAALQSAVARMEALIAKKAQMKQEFINKLRFLSDRAAEALEIFSAPGYGQQIADALDAELSAKEGDKNGAGDAKPSPPNGAGDAGESPTEPDSAAENESYSGAGTSGNPKRRSTGKASAEVPAGVGRASRKQRNDVAGKGAKSTTGNS